jgi:hypothetical protein
MDAEATIEVDEEVLAVRRYLVHATADEALLCARLDEVSRAHAHSLELATFQYACEASRCAMDGVPLRHACNRCAAGSRVRVHGAAAVRGCCDIARS